MDTLLKKQTSIPLVSGESKLNRDTSPDAAKGNSDKGLILEE